MENPVNEPNGFSLEMDFSMSYPVGFVLILPIIYLNTIEQTFIEQTVEERRSAQLKVASAL